jgi:hypothetical protein
VLALILLTIALYFVPGLSDLSFIEKTSLILTFSIAVFAAIEGYAAFKHSENESKRYIIEDARNELEKAYGPLYTLLNNRAACDDKKGNFWLEFEEREKLDEIMATYPFMFPTSINNMWRDRIRGATATLYASTLESGRCEDSLKVYLEFRELINEEYERKTKKYRALLEK